MAEDESTWLDASDLQSVLGDDLAEPIDSTSAQEYCDGTRSYVEGKRKDLFAPAVDEDDPRVFTPTPAVRLGAAMLAYRFYSRRTSPLGVIGFTEDGAVGMLREDPDIAKLLGIGRFGRFVFGAAGTPGGEEESA